MTKGVAAELVSTRVQTIKTEMVAIWILGSMARRYDSRTCLTLNFAGSIPVYSHLPKDSGWSTCLTNWYIELFSLRQPLRLQP